MKKTDPNNAAQYFPLFCDECTYWQRRFSLLRWEIVYSIGDIGVVCARVAWDESNMQANITLGQDWTGYDHVLSNYEICATSFHEVCELFLASINTLSSSRVDEKELDSNKHSIIHVLEDLIFQPYWDKRRRDINKKKPAPR